jgi:chromosome segregation ATPase
LRARHRVYQKLRQEAQTLQQEWLRRSAVLAKEQRTLAERALALEQYRQQCISRSANPKTAEKRLERLRRRWASVAASTERKLAAERKALETQSARLEAHARQLQDNADDLATQEADLSARQAAWEERQVQDQAEHEAMRHELGSARNQRRSYEQQIQALNEEVERLARFLLDGNDSATVSISQAA